MKNLNITDILSDINQQNSLNENKKQVEKQELLKRLLKKHEGEPFDFKKGYEKLRSLIRSFKMGQNKSMAIKW